MAAAGSLYTSFARKIREEARRCSREGAPCAPRPTYDSWGLWNLALSVVTEEAIRAQHGSDRKAFLTSLSTLFPSGDPFKDRDLGPGDFWMLSATLMDPEAPAVRHAENVRALGVWAQLRRVVAAIGAPEELLTEENVSGRATESTYYWQWTEGP